MENEDFSYEISEKKVDALKCIYVKIHYAEYVEKEGEFGEWKNILCGANDKKDVCTNCINGVNCKECLSILNKE